MMCAWDDFLKILPSWISVELTKLDCTYLEELRLRRFAPPELSFGHSSRWLSRTVSGEDLDFVINTSSRYSPWAAATMGQGYLTSRGGHRIGLCGEAVISGGNMTGIRSITGLCIRAARDYPGIGSKIAKLEGSILILGPPGSGKTTLLRDTLRQIADTETVSVADERGEIFPVHFQRGKRMDVMTGCPKAAGIEMLLRTMGPQTIGVDEITSREDCDALIRAGWCGVRLVATAHAASVFDLKHRPVYSALAETGLFDHIVVLRRDKTWREEALTP